MRALRGSAGAEGRVACCELAAPLRARSTPFRAPARTGLNVIPALIMCALVWAPLLQAAVAAAAGSSPSCNATGPAFLEGLTVDSVSDAPPLVVAYSSLSAPSMVAAEAQRVALQCLLHGHVEMLPLPGHHEVRAALNSGRAHYAVVPAPDTEHELGNSTASLSRSGLDERVAFAATQSAVQLAGPGASVAGLAANATVLDRSALNATSWPHLLGPPVWWDDSPADAASSFFVAAPPRASAAFQAGCIGAQSLLARAAAHANISCRPAHSQDAFRQALLALEPVVGAALVGLPSRAAQGTSLCDPLAGCRRSLLCRPGPRGAWRGRGRRGDHSAPRACGVGRNAVLLAPRRARPTLLHRRGQ